MGIKNSLKLGALMFAGMASVASAQNIDSLRKAMMVDLPPTTQIAAGASRGAPASSAGSPSAYGANWGDGFAGAGWQSRMRYVKNKPFRDRQDGSVVVGFGLGNSRDHLGVEVSVTSFSTLRSGFGNHSAISLKAHRALPKNIGAAIGWENALRTDGTDGGKSIYGVLTTVLQTRERRGDPFSSVTLSGGVGGGRFQSEQAIRDGKNGVNAFGSIGVRVLSPVSFIADWAGQDLALAVSFVPFAQIPLVITPSLNDVTGSAGDGVRFTIGAGTGFRFAKIRDILAPNR